MAQKHPLDPVLREFRAVARAVAPLTGDFDARAWSEAEAVVAEGLAERPAKMIAQVRLFLRVLDLLALLRHARRLRSLPPEKTLGLLGALERSPLLLLRRGVWGVRTLAFMGAHTQPDVADALGYRGDPAGWDARGADRVPWPDRGGAAPVEPEVGEMLGGSSGAAGGDGV